jgi:large subunit ribosomal protein L23
VVDKDSNKLEIKKAVEEIFKVKVKKVTTMNIHGKVKRMGRFEGKRPNWKKAVVQLVPGQTIELFETV